MNGPGNRATISILDMIYGAHDHEVPCPRSRIFSLARPIRSGRRSPRKGSILLSSRRGRRGSSCSCSTTSPTGGRARSSRCRRRRTGRATFWHIFVEGLPNETLYNFRADGPYNPAADGTRFNVTKTLIDPYAPAITGDFYWQSGDALGYDNTDPDDPDRHLRPEHDRQRRRGPAVRGLPERLRLGGGPAPRHPDRGVDHLRGQRPRLHPPPLLRERPGGHLPRLHREDPAI